MYIYVICIYIYYIYICIYIINIYIYIYIKLYGPFLWMCWNYLRGDSLLFTRNSWYSLDQPQKDERMKFIFITKYKLKLQYVKLTQLWPLTVNCFKVSSQSYLAGLSKICFLCTCHNFIWLVNFIENVYLGAKDFFGIKWKNPR